MAGVLGKTPELQEHGTAGAVRGSFANRGPLKTRLKACVRFCQREVSGRSTPGGGAAAQRLRGREVCGGSKSGE